MKSAFLDALEKATKDDLDAINEHITELETELGKRKSQRKMIEILLGVEPTKGKGGPRKKTAVKNDTDDDDYESVTTTKSLQASSSGTNADAKRVKIAKLLLNGPRRIAEVQEEIGAAAQGFNSVITHPWFDRTPDGSLRLTIAGRAAATRNGGL